MGLFVSRNRYCIPIITCYVRCYPRDLFLVGTISLLFNNKTSKFFDIAANDVTMHGTLKRFQVANLGSCHMTLITVAMAPACLEWVELTFFILPLAKSARQQSVYSMNAGLADELWNACRMKQLPKGRHSFF